MLDRNSHNHKRHTNKSQKRNDPGCRSLKESHSLRKKRLTRKTVGFQKAILSKKIKNKMFKRDDFSHLPRCWRANQTVSPKLLQAINVCNYPTTKSIHILLPNLGYQTHFHCNKFQKFQHVRYSIIFH